MALKPAIPLRSDEAATRPRAEQPAPTSKESGTRSLPHSPADRALRELEAIQSALQSDIEQGVAESSLQRLRIHEQRLENALEASLNAPEPQQAMDDRRKLLEALPAIRHAIREIQQRLPHHAPEEGSGALRTIPRQGADATHLDAVEKAAEEGTIHPDLREHKADMFRDRRRRLLDLQSKPSLPPAEKLDEDAAETERLRRLIEALEGREEDAAPSGVRLRTPAAERKPKDPSTEIARIEKQQAPLAKRIFEKYGKNPEDITWSDGMAVTHGALHALMGEKSDLQEWRELEEWRKTLADEEEEAA
ncbi:MAG: hypothetical protein RL141_1013 [Candidatus Parcubacteria bacterium]|jgi:hypothetical protein